MTGEFRTVRELREWLERFPDEAVAWGFDDCIVVEWPKYEQHYFRNDREDGKDG